MDDPKNIRLNDADDPDRREKFSKAFKRAGGNGNAIIRQLVDAWLHYIAEHGHAPNFPVRLVPIDPDQKKR